MELLNLYPDPKITEIKFLLQVHYEVLSYIYLMILVTGSTGLVGTHLILALIENKQKVRALYRSEKNKKEVESSYAFAKAESCTHLIDWQQGDITNLPRLQEIFLGVTYVYHCAAFISFDPYQFKKLTKINVEGTANVVNLCLSEGVKKLIHLSSIATLSKTPYSPINENNYWDPNERVSVYGLTKYGAEMEVWRGTEEGLDAVILNPGIILGEGNYDKGSSLLFKRAWEEKQFYPKGATGIIDVKDVVNLMMLAMQSTIKQERFVAVSENITYKNLSIAISEALHKKPPTIAIPSWTLHIAVFIDFIIGLFNRERSITKASIQSLQKVSVYSNDKIKRDLKYTPTPLKETLQRIAQDVKLNL